jgi:drug/metabolite transporter (DMT)-like permease
MTAEAVGINRTTGVPLAVLGVLFFTPDAALLRLVHLDGWSLLLWRGGLTALALVTWIVATTPRQELVRTFKFDRLGWVAVAGLTVSNLAFVHAILNAPAADALVMLACSPLIAALIGWIGFGESVPLRTWVAIAAVLAGILITLNGAALTGGLVGGLIALVAACGFALELNAIRFSRTSDPLAIVAVAGALGAVVGLTVAVASGTLHPLSATQLAIVGVHGLLLHPASFGLIAASTRYLPGAEIALISLAETLLGPLWVWLVFSEVPTPSTVLGGSIVLGTLVLHSLASWRAA